MKSGKLHSSPRIGLLFYIIVSLLCGTMAENALGQVPPGMGQDPNGWFPKTGGPSKSGELFPAPGPGSKGPPQCVLDILGKCHGAIDPKTLDADQRLTAMFQGLCNELTESCKSLIATCTVNQNRLSRSLNMIFDNEKDAWCLVDPLRVVAEQNNTYKDNCLASGLGKPSPQDLCKLLVPEARSNPGYPCTCTATVSKPGKIIMPQTTPQYCGATEKGLPDCGTCCERVSKEFLKDKDVDTQKNWKKSCNDSCVTYNS